MKLAKFHISFIVAIVLLFTITGFSQEIVPGASRYEEYLSLLSKKKVGLVVNHTSMCGDEHLVDVLLSKGVLVKKIFAPEHGFRGESEAGETVGHAVDSKTKLPIVSLYGDRKKPTPSDLAGLDILVFDIQDVGCRFFTYISTMFYVMEACAENNLPLIVLDRPNPNGDYVDGPVLKPEMKSFVGMVPIPVVHGCTLGELALMFNGEGWLSKGKRCRLTIIPVLNYTHSSTYILPVKPSPNLPNHTAVRLYPSLCLFEATTVSVGRGTDFPFQVLGYPDPAFGNFSFVPVSIPGVCKNPIHENKSCYGDDFRTLNQVPRFTLTYFIEYYSRFSNTELFWSDKRWIGLLTGDPNFYNQVTSRMSEVEIRKTWQPDLKIYKDMRKKYLLYSDFE